MRIFNGWQCTFGNDQQGNPILHSVPVQYGDLSRQVATIIANNSPSQLPAVPFISIYISGLEYDQRRMQEPTFQDSLTVRQRAINQETGQYETTQGQAFTVKRLMPVPYNLRFTVDIWTSNYKQKLEIMEQLSVLFNPALELQSNPNVIDWTSLSVVFQDGITWTSRTIPQGTGNPIDVLTWKFYTPVWISTPIKVEKLGIIQKIIASVFKGSALEDTQNEDLLLGQRQVITPYGYKLLLVGGQLQLLPNDEPLYPPNSDVESIASVLINRTDPSSSFVFYTTDPCLDVEVGQWVQFDGVEGYPEVTAITVIGAAPNPTEVAITLSIQQTELEAGKIINFLPKLNPPTDLYWKAYLNVLGTIRPGVSMIRLQNPQLQTEIEGTISFYEQDDRLLNFTIDTDTLPKCTLPSVLSVINPTQKFPNTAENMNGTLPVASNGQRYLIVDDIGTDATAELVLKTRSPLAAGQTMIEIQLAFDTESSKYIGSYVQATNPITKQPIFTQNTMITDLTQLASTMWLMTVNKQTIESIPQTWDGTNRTTIYSIEISTTNPIVTTAWGGLVAHANDIIEYGTNTIITTTSDNSLAGGYIISVSDNTGIKVGFEVAGDGIMVGTKVTNVNGKIITIDTPLINSFGVGVQITFTKDDTWYVSFDSNGGAGSPASQVQFIENMTTNIQYRWYNGQWTKSYEGFYDAGDWSIVI